jgi:xanthine dehydrogenase molybdopterin-binding subunit B
LPSNFLSGLAQRFLGTPQETSGSATVTQVDQVAGTVTLQTQLQYQDIHYNAQVQQVFQEYGQVVNTNHVQSALAQQMWVRDYQTDRLIIQEINQQNVYNPNSFFHWKDDFKEVKPQLRLPSWF